MAGTVGEIIMEGEKREEVRVTGRRREKELKGSGEKMDSWNWKRR